jgi:hypothetical protein
MVYLTTLLGIQEYIYICYERMLYWPNLRYHPGIYLQRLRKTIKTAKIIDVHPSFEQGTI